MLSGIYQWTSPSGKSYIGQAVNLKRRKKEFLWFNSAYTSKGSAIDNARIKYHKSEDWKYEVLEYCKIEDLNNREKYWISANDTYNQGYNSTEGGDGAKGIIISDETKKKISIKAKQRNLRGSRNPNYGHHLSDEAKERIRQAHLGKPLCEKTLKAVSKPVIQLTLDNKFIREWNSAADAARYFECGKSLIGRVCQGKKKTAKGFHWKFK